MAFGDLVKSLQFTQFSEVATFSSPCAVGNSIIVATTTTGGTQTCSDDLHGAYTKIEEVRDTTNGLSVAIFLVEVTDGGAAPTITLGSASLRTYAYEIEGVLSYSGAQANAVLSPMQTGTVAFSSGSFTIPAGAVSFGVWSASVAGNGITADSPWSVLTGSLNGFRVASRVDSLEAAGADFSGTYEGFASSNHAIVLAASFTSGSIPSLRKGSQFDIETTLSGTVTAATLNGNAITVDSQVGTTVTLTDSGSGVTTSGEYNLVLTDDSADPDETIAVQVNVYGVAPSNNPLQKDGSALASLTGVQLRVTAGANLNGTELYYSGTGTTDASGNLGNIDLSSTAAADTDPVLLHMRTSAGDSIIASETVGLI